MKRLASKHQLTSDG